MTPLAQLYTGKNIQQSHTEALQPINLETLANQIRSGSGGLQELCAQLATIYKMDKAAYGRHKLRLPFFCCAGFAQNLRHSKNFTSIEACVLDFDKAPNPGYVQQNIMPLLQSDERVALAFTSPSGRGAKAVLLFNQPVTNLHEYAMGYKNLTRSFAQQYGLEAYADFSTCDATRVCFLAYDPQVYYQPLAQPISWHQYLPPQKHPTPPAAAQPDTASPSPSKNNDTPIDTITPDTPTSKPSSNTLPPKLYEQVVKRLNPTAVTRQAREVVVPEILEEVAIQAQAAIAAAGWQLKDIQNIQYGKKIAVAQGFVWAEVNIFYGKKGFSIVRTPKAGTNAALGQQLEQLLWQTLQQPVAIDYHVNPPE